MEKIADLFAALAIRPDRRSFDQGRREIDRFARDTDRRLMNLRAGLNKRAGDGVRNFAGGLGIGTIGAAAFGAALVSTAKDSLAFEESVVRLDVSARGAMGSLDQMQDRIIAVSNATGVSKEELTAGSAAYVALTGDGKTASKVMDVFAKTQVATGAAMEDVVGSAAALSDQLGVNATDFERMFSILIAGGKAGKIEMKDMAGLTASLAASYKQFGGSKGIGGVAGLGAAFQVTAKNFGSASEAATGLEALMGSLIQNAKKLKKEGVEVFGKDGKLRGLMEIVDSLTGKGFNETKLIDLLGRKEAFKTLQALRDNRKMVDDISKATMKATDVADDYAKVSQAGAVKARKAWNELKNEMTSIVTPERLEKGANFAKGWLNIVSKFPGWKALKFGASVAEDIASGNVGEDPTLRSMPDDALRSIVESGRSRLQFGGAVGPGFDRGQQIRMEKELSRREADRQSARRSSIIGAGGSPFSFPEQMFDTEGAMRSDGAIRGVNNTISLGGIKVSLTVPPGTDADAMGNLVTKQIREAFDKAARDIAAATVQ